MPMTIVRPSCPQCGKAMALHHSRTRKNGILSRRFRCRLCETAFTEKTTSPVPMTGRHVVSDDKLKLILMQLDLIRHSLMRIMAGKQK